MSDYKYEIGQKVQYKGDSPLKGEIVLIGADCSKHGSTCTWLKISWQAANIGWEHSSLLELVLPPKTDNTGMSDKADEIYQEGLTYSNATYAQMRDFLDKEPFVVIGNFAYVLAYNGSVYLAPYSPDTGVKWGHAAEITDHYDRTDFPANRLASLLGDLGNMRDILRQHGVKGETDKQ